MLDKADMQPFYSKAGITLVELCSRSVEEQMWLADSRHPQKGQSLDTRRKVISQPLFGCFKEMTLTSSPHISVILILDLHQLLRIFRIFRLWHTSLSGKTFTAYHEHLIDGIRLLS